MTSISTEALDEIEGAEWRPSRVVYGSKVGDVLRTYLLRYRTWPERRELDRLITRRPGSAEQLAALNAYDDEHGMHAVNSGTARELDEVNIVCLLALCSPLQRARFAGSWTYWRNLTGVG